jgi:hypothetical protein
MSSMAELHHLLDTNILSAPWANSVGSRNCERNIAA